MNEKVLSVMKERFYRCYACGSLIPGEEINENGKIKCRQIVLRHCRYEYCNVEFNVSDYNAFTKVDGHEYFKKFLPAQHWW